jgi:uncharacterized damage-inducible protein DinB
MTKQEALTLLDYHYWARDRVLDALDALTPEQYMRDLGSSFTSVRDTLVHTYGAEFNWYSRWTGTSPTGMLDPNLFPDLASVHAAWREHEGKVRAFVGRMDQRDLERTLDYKMLTGEPASSVFWHMLQHVVNHASYHRGQLTTMLRQLGAPPPKPQDLIRYYREQSAPTS